MSKEAEADRAKAMAGRQRDGRLSSNAYDIAQSVSSADITELLEGLVDRVPLVVGEENGESGFSGVITQLGNVAGEKAEHLRHAWQDNAAADRYDALCEALWAFAGSIDLV